MHPSHLPRRLSHISAGAGRRLLRWLNRPSSARLLVLTGVFFLASGIYYLQISRGDLSATNVSGALPTITNQATALYCSEGDDASVCDPASGKYSGNASSNVVSIQLTDVPAVSQVCLVLSAQAAHTDPYVGVTVKIIDPTTQAVVATLSGLTSQSDGTLAITDSQFLSSLSVSTTYDVWVKPTGFLGRRLHGISDFSGCRSLATDERLLMGDLDGNNKITLADALTGIRQLNSPDPTLSTAFSRFGLADALTLIRNMNANPTGDN